MFDLTTYVKKWQIRQLKTVFSTLDTLWRNAFQLPAWVLCNRWRKTSLACGRQEEVENLHQSYHLHCQGYQAGRLQSSCQEQGWQLGKGTSIVWGVGDLDQSLQEWAGRDVGLFVILFWAKGGVLGAGAGWRSPGSTERSWPIQNSIWWKDERHHKLQGMWQIAQIHSVDIVSVLNSQHDR